MRQFLLKHLPALLAAIPALWVAASEGVWAARWTVVLTVGVAGVMAFTRLTAGVRLETAWRWLVSLVGWALLCAVLRPVPMVEAAPFVGVGGVSLLLALAAHGPRGKAWAVPAVFCAGAIAAAWLVIERALSPGRPAGPFENPNVAATLALLGIAISPALRLPLIVRGGALTLMVGGISAAGSRASLLGILAVGGAWALRAAGRRTRAAAVVLVALACVALTLRLVSDRDPLRFERVRIWSSAARTALAELPFGCGPGGFGDAVLPHNFPRQGELARFHRVPGIAENDFLQLLAALGLPGAILGLGLAVSVVRGAMRGGLAGLGVVAALLLTSSVHTQLMLPVVAWVATLAVVAVLPRQSGRQMRLASPLAGVAIVLLCVASAAAVTWPGWGKSPIEAAVERGAQLIRQRCRDDALLADAQAAVWRGCALRPRYSRAWTVLGSLRLERAMLRGETLLALDAAEAYATSRLHNPLNVWAALGEGRVWRLLGDGERARRALGEAVTLEPNCVPAWMELTLLHLERGEVTRARGSLERAETALREARRHAALSGYERTLAGVDVSALERLRARCGRAR